MGDAAELIRATDHFQEAAITHRLKDILLCVDLAILGQDDEVYQNYTRAIRQEYIHLPDAKYRAQRGGALAHLSRKAQAGSCSATPTSPTSTTSAPSTTCSAKWSASRSNRGQDTGAALAGRIRVQFLAGGEGFAQFHQVQLGFADFGEHVVFLFADVVVDHFRQHLDLGVEQVVGRAPCSGFARSGLWRRRARPRFIHQVVFLDGLAHGRVEDFFLDHGVPRQLIADLQCQLVLADMSTIAQFFILLEQRFDMLVVFGQQRDGVLRIGFGRDGLGILPVCAKWFSCRLLAWRMGLTFSLGVRRASVCALLNVVAAGSVWSAQIRNQCPQGSCTQQHIHDVFGRW
jgi:hypothetical protein